MEIRISVRNLVEFILRSGNIDNRRTAAPENAMQEGGRIHRMIQRKMGSDYHAEVFLRYIMKYRWRDAQTALSYRQEEALARYRSCRRMVLRLLTGIW